MKLINPHPCNFFPLTCHLALIAKGSERGFVELPGPISGVTQWPSLRRLTAAKLPAFRGRHNMRE